MSPSCKGDMNYWKSAFMCRPGSNVVSESSVTSPKVTQEIIINLLQRVAATGVCTFVHVCAQISVFL